MKAFCLPGFVALFLLVACGKREHESIGRKSEVSKADSSPSPAVEPKPSPEGFYVNKTYLKELRASRSIHGTTPPNGTISIYFQDDSADFNYNNHEGGFGRITLWSLEKPIVDSSKCYVVPINDTTILAWERWAGEFREFVKVPSKNHRIADIYEEEIVTGRYRCRDTSFCDSVVVISPDSAFGFKGGPRAFRYYDDFNDNMPQMDYFLLMGGDTVAYAYKVVEDRMELHQIDLADSCEDVMDTQCPLSDSKVGSLLFEIERMK